MLRIGIAGIGSIARDYMKLISEGRVHAKLTAISSRKMENMQQALVQTGLSGVCCYTDYHEMLKSKKIDLVMICTPHFQHPQMAMDALEEGIHPLVEKPLGVYASEGELLCKAAAAHPELVCGVLYCRRMNRVFQEVKRMIADGAIGYLKRASWMITNLYRTEAYHKSSPWRGKYSSEGGGVLMNQAAHQLDLFLWLIGEMPELVHGFCYTGMERKIQVENDAHVHMRFANGATGQFTASSREFPGSNRLELIGDCGQIIVENDSYLRYTKLKISEQQFSQTTDALFGPVPNEVSETTYPIADNLSQQSDIINDFLAAVQMGGKPICSLEEAQRSLMVINAAYLSAWENRSISFPFSFSNFKTQMQKRF